MGKNLPPYQFKLFVLGNSSKGNAAIQSLKEINKVYFNNKGSFEVIDLSTNIELANQYKVIATPMLIKIKPAPIQRIFGKLDKIEDIIRFLDLPEIKEEARYE